METRANYILLGAVAIVGAALIMVFAMWLARSEWSQEFATYEVVFEGPVRGLANGGEVRFNGIKVGEVEQLVIDPDNANRVIARIRVSATTPVKADTEGRLEQIGLTGVTLIQLSGGDDDLPVLRQGLGQPPPRIVGRPDPLSEVVAAGGDIASRVNDALLRVQRVLTEENISAISRSVANLEAITSELAAHREMFAEVGPAILAVRDAGEAAAGLSRDAQGRLAGLDQQGSDLLSQSQATIANLDAAILATRGLIDTLEDAAGAAASQTLPEMTLALQDVRRLSGALERLTGEIEADPYGFVFDGSRPTVEVAP
jgi:phospholipid/cholesterol/gamma-HCH transport system substrate-binding protein